MPDRFLPPIGTLRILFLYVGQGEATLLIIPDGDSHQYVLVDSNMSEDKKYLYLPEFLSSLPKNALVYVNTHPHKDHLSGVSDIHEAIGLREIWHSGHLPHKDNRTQYNEMQSVIRKIGCENEYFLRGTNRVNTLHRNKDDNSHLEKVLGDVSFQVLSPAKFICEDIDEELPEDRRKRIHEQCAVIKFTYGDFGFLITGDSDKTTWKEHITEYYGDVLPCTVLSASHHGSRSFFVNSSTDEDIYKEHIEKISPAFLIVSAPKDSPHEHPHKDAMKIYENYIDKNNIRVLGEIGSSLQLDVSATGELIWEEFSHQEQEKQLTPPIQGQSPFPRKPTLDTSFKPYAPKHNEPINL